MSRSGPAVLLAFSFFFVLAGCGVSAPFQNAPDFSLQDARSSRKIRLSHLNQEKPVLLVFWATWCPSCREEIPQVNEIYRKYAAQGLQVLAVNVQESSQTVQPFLRDAAVQYPVVLDQSGEVSAKYHIEGLPTSVLLAKGGKILYYGFSLPGNLSELLETRRTS